MTEPYYPSPPKGGIPNEVPLNYEIPLCFGTEPLGLAVGFGINFPHRFFVGFRLLAFIVTCTVGVSPLTATLLLFERPKRSKQEKSRPGRFFSLIRPMTS